MADDSVYRCLRERFGDYFDGGMGAEAIKRLLMDYDVEAEGEFLRDKIENGKGTRRLKAIKRLKVVSNFVDGKSTPHGHGAGRRAGDPAGPASDGAAGRRPVRHVDLNDLYRRVINRNNRLKRLLDLQAPEIIVNHEADAPGGRRRIVRQRPPRASCHRPGQQQYEWLSSGAGSVVLLRR